MNNRRCIILFGPTGVGKTDLSLAIAHAISGEIVNMDMGQLYTPLSIGTAKPTIEQRKEIVHHLFDIINEPIDFNAFAYRRAVSVAMENIWQRNKIPIIVGGSGFYLISLLFQITTPGQSHQQLVNVDNLYPPETSWWNTLYMIDPERARSINKNDLYRIKRALAIWHTYYIKPSTYTSQYSPIAPVHLFFLERERSDLYNRINRRIYSMIDDGWILEINKLLNTAWEEFLLRKKLIGYDDLIRYLHGGDTSPQALQDTIAILQQKTRNYAKRQITFAKMIQKKLSFMQICGKVQYDTSVKTHMLSLTDLSYSNCVDKILTALKQDLLS